MIKYRALQDIAVGKRVVSMKGDSVITRLPEGSQAQGSLMDADKEIPVKMRTSCGRESTMLLPEYYPCRIDKVLREDVLKQFRINRSVWSSRKDSSTKGDSNMARKVNVKSIEKKIKTNEKDVLEWKAELKAAQKKKDKKAITKAQDELDWCVNRISELKEKLTAKPAESKKGEKKSGKAEVKDADTGLFVMLQYA